MKIRWRGGVGAKWKRELGQHKANQIKRAKVCNCNIPHSSHCKRKGYPQGCVYLYLKKNNK